MAVFENPLSFVRSIKGAPASVIWALLFVRRPMTNEELELWTGYTDDTIRKALRLLVNLGWVTALSSQGPWRLSEGRQFPPMDNFLPTPEILGASSSSSLNKESEELIEQEEQRPPKFSERREALFAAGVREPKASRLAALPHVTPEYIRAHLEQASREGHPIGTVIYRIENGWEAAPVRDDDNRNKYIEGKYADIIQH